MESTDRQEETFLSFDAGGRSYVLPLQDVGQIAAGTPEDLPEIPLAGPQDKKTSAIVFQDASGLAALKVGRVEGLVQIPPESQYELPDAARSPQNAWIAGVAFLEQTRRLCYLLDARKLRECFPREEP